MESLTCSWVRLGQDVDGRAPPLARGVRQLRRVSTEVAPA